MLLRFHDPKHQNISVCATLRRPSVVPCGLRVLLAQRVWQRFPERFETVVVSRQLECSIIKLNVDDHRLHVTRPTLLVEEIVLDVLVCITSWLVVPLACRLPDVLWSFSVPVVSAITDSEISIIEFRAAPEQEYNWKRMLCASMKQAAGSKMP